MKYIYEYKLALPVAKTMRNPEKLLKSTISVSPFRSCFGDLRHIPAFDVMSSNHFGESPDSKSLIFLEKNTCKS